MWKNKHVIVAMLVAPALAIMAWFAVDYFVAEQARPAVTGAAYPLVARSNCRYASGQCDLVNEDFVLTFRQQRLDGAHRLMLSASHPLSAARIAMATDAALLDAPRALAQTDAAGKEWSLPVDVALDDPLTMRVAVVAGGSTFYAETAAAFLTSADEP